MKCLLTRVFLGCSLILAGCGGSSSPSSSPTAVRFSIFWGVRSKDINGPSSALSAVLTLTHAAPSGGDLVIEEDRSATPAAYSQTYTSSQTAKTGAFPLTVNFYDQAGGTGDVVATGTATVTIHTDGSGIGDVEVANKVASVAVTPGQVIETPGTLSLTFTARDSGGNLIAVSPGSGTWTQVDGNRNVSLTPDGTATGLQHGMSNVEVTVDGVTSAPTEVAATADPGGPPTVLNFDSLQATPSQVSGTPVPPADQLSTQYLATYGISFSSLLPYVAIMGMPPGTAPSPPNCIGGVSTSGVIQYGQATPVNFTFFDPSNTTAPGVIESFSVTADLDGNPNNTVQLEAFDVNGNMVASTSAADVGGEILTISLPAPTIHQIVFLGAPGTDSGVGLDNVTFSPVVPPR